MKLTAKQEKFCHEYMVDLNASQASIRAGYSPKTAGVIGQENLKKPLIQARIRELQAETQKRTKITIDDVVEKIWYIAVEGEEENNRLKALDMMMKHLGGFTADNKTDMSVEIEIV